MTTLRIGVDMRGLLTGTISGVEQYTLSILRSLFELDHHNTYVLFYISYRDMDTRMEKLLEEHPFLKGDNIEVKPLHWVNFPLLLHALFKPLDWPKVDKVIGGLDVMFMPSPRLLPLSSDCKKVTTFHDLIFFRYPEYYDFKSRLWQWQMSYGYEARSSDKVIAVSEATKRDLIKLCAVDPSRIEVVYEAAAEYYSIPSTPELFERLKEKHDLPEQYLFYVGSLEPRKNIGSVVRALDQIRNLSGDTMKLVISGGKSWLTSEVYRLIEELKLENQVIFTGRVTEEEKIALYNHALALVFPSFYEGFGLMILEAYAAGCAVITSNVSSLPEIAGSAALLVDPHKPEDLAAAILRLKQDSNLRTELIAKGRARAQQFSWDAAAQHTLNIIEQTGGR